MNSVLTFLGLGGIHEVRTQLGEVKSSEMIIK